MTKDMCKTAANSLRSPKSAIGIQSFARFSRNISDERKNWKNTSPREVGFPHISLQISNGCLTNASEKYLESITADVLILINSANETGHWRSVASSHLPAED
jgi:hypothetical protein